MYGRKSLTDVSNTVDRTVAKKVIDDIKFNLDIDNKAFIMVQRLLESKTYYTGVNVSLDKNEHEHPIAEKINVKMDSKKVNNYTPHTNYYQGEDLIKNKYLNIKTEYYNYEMNINIRYTTKSEANALRLQSNLRDNAIRQQLMYVHFVNYFYSIPPEVLKLIETIYTVGSQDNSSLGTFIDFLKKANVGNRLSLQSDINGYEGDLGLAGVAMNRIEGMFDIEILNNPVDFDNDTDTFTVETNYVINYLRPEALLIKYNGVINNKLLPEEYLIRKRDCIMDETRYTDVGFLDKIEYIFKSRPYVNIPSWDNAYVDIPVNTLFLPIALVLTVITKDDKKTLFNLKDLEDYKFNKKYIDYLTNTFADIKNDYKKLNNIFYLELYQDDVLTNIKLNVDKDLNVISDVDLSMTSLYRIGIKVLTDFTKLKKDKFKLAKSLVTNNSLEKILVCKTKELDNADYVTIENIKSDNYQKVMLAQVSIINTFDVNQRK